MPRQGEHKVRFGWEMEAPHALAVVPITSSDSDCRPRHAQRVPSGQERCQQTPGARQPRGNASACLLRMFSCLSSELYTRPSHLCISPFLSSYSLAIQTLVNAHIAGSVVLFLQGNSQLKPKIWCQICVVLGADPHSPQPCKGKSWSGGHTATFSHIPSTWAFGHQDLFFTSNTPRTSCRSSSGLQPASRGRSPPCHHNYNAVCCNTAVKSPRAASL